MYSLSSSLVDMIKIEKSLMQCLYVSLMLYLNNLCLISAGIGDEYFTEDQ